MYKNGEKKFSLTKIILIALAIFLIIFILIWLTNKGKNKASTEAFNKNMIDMQLVSKEYFKKHLPQEDENKIITLEDMYDLKLIDKLTLNNKDCDIDKSYSYITAFDDNYKVTTTLVCGNVKDTKSQMLYATEDDEDEEKEEETSCDDNCNCECKCECNCEMNCDIIPTPVVCDDIVEYEYIKKGVAYCPTGYTFKNSTCQKEVIEMKNPTSKTTSTNAKVSSKEEKTYKNPIITTTPGTKYCTSGSLINNKCVTTSYKDKVASTTTKTVAASKGYTSWSNPSGTYSVSKPESTYTYELEKKVEVGRNEALGIYTYAIYKRSVVYSCSQGTLSGSSCIIKTTTYSCPSGYADNGSNCIKTTTTDPKTTDPTTTYSCESGYTKEGSGSSTKCYKTVKIGSYYCEDKDATLKGDKCYKTSLTCDKDYTLTKNVCTKTTTKYTDPITPATKVVWSTKTALDGYTRTGQTRKTTVCHEVTK